jgi:hypothetical protein
MNRGAAVTWSRRRSSAATRLADVAATVAMLGGTARPRDVAAALGLPVRDVTTALAHAAARPSLYHLRRVGPGLYFNFQHAAPGEVATVTE